MEICEEKEHAEEEAGPDGMRNIRGEGHSSPVAAATSCVQPPIDDALHGGPAAAATTDCNGEIDGCSGGRNSLSQNGAVALVAGKEKQAEGDALHGANPAAPKETTPAGVAETAPSKISSGTGSLAGASVRESSVTDGRDHHDHINDYHGASAVSNGVPNGFVVAGGAAPEKEASVGSTQTTQETDSLGGGVDGDGDALMVDESTEAVAGERGARAASAAVAQEDVPQSTVGEVTFSSGVVSSTVRESGKREGPVAAISERPVAVAARVAHIEDRNSVQRCATAVVYGSGAPLPAAYAGVTAAVDGAGEAGEETAGVAAEEGTRTEMKEPADAMPPAAEGNAAATAANKEAAEAVEATKAAAAAVKQKTRADEKRAREACQDACLRLLLARGSIALRTRGWSVEQLLALRGGVLELGAALCGRGMPGAKAKSAAEAVDVVVRYLERRLP